MRDGQASTRWDSRRPRKPRRKKSEPPFPAVACPLGRAKPAGRALLRLFHISKTLGEPTLPAKVNNSGIKGGLASMLGAAGEGGDHPLELPPHPPTPRKHGSLGRAQSSAGGNAGCPGHQNEPGPPAPPGLPHRGKVRPSHLSNPAPGGTRKTGNPFPSPPCSSPLRPSCFGNLQRIPTEAHPPPLEHRHPQPQH